MTKKKKRTIPEPKLQTVQKGNLEVCKHGDFALLKIGDTSVRLKDYQIVSTAHGGTEITVKLNVDDSLTGFTMLTRTAKSKGWKGDK